MADIKLDHSLLIINLSFTRLDTLIESIAKADALTQILLGYNKENLKNIPAVVLHNFLWTLDGLIYQANNLYTAVHCALLVINLNKTLSPGFSR